MCDEVMKLMACFFDWSTWYTMLSVLKVAMFTLLLKAENLHILSPYAVCMPSE